MKKKNTGNEFLLLWTIVPIRENFYCYTQLLLAGHWTEAHRSCQHCWNVPATTTGAAMIKDF